jgi:hypothetical protein
MKISWFTHVRRHVGLIPDKKRLVWMGCFLFCSGIILSGYWLYDGDPDWWFGITFMMGFYLSVLIVAYLLRNNP